MVKPITSLLLCSLFLGAAVAFYVDFDNEMPGAGAAGLAENSDYALGDDMPSVSKRYAFSPACRRCLSEPSDWYLCSVCYSASAPVPFFGFEKRSQETADFLPSAQASSAGERPSPGDSLGALDNMATMVQKRASFLTCRCCISLNNRHCCEKCSLTPYYGKRSSPMNPTGFREAALSNRGSSTTLFATGLFHGSSLCGVCCNPETYDPVCCVNMCSKKK